MQLLKSINAAAGENAAADRIAPEDACKIVQDSHVQVYVLKPDNHINEERTGRRRRLCTR